MTIQITEHTLKVGDILRSTWGCEQSNVDFYEVIKLTGKQSVTLEKLKIYRSTVKGIGLGLIMPARGCPEGKSFTKKVRCKTCVKIDSFSTAFLWKGLPESSTDFYR